MKKKEWLVLLIKVELPIRLISAEAPVGYKIAITGKSWKARGERWEEGKTSLLLFPLSIVPRALSFLPSLASLRYKEASAEEKENELFFEDVRVFYISNAFKRKQVDWNGLQKCHLEGSLCDFSEESVYMHQVFRLINLGALVLA